MPHSRRKKCSKLPKNVIWITQNDFVDGTYRIKTPGYYALKESICFNPTFGENNNRPDLPPNGFWFAGITVETDGVILDGRYRGFKESRDYFNANIIGTYAHVIIGNNTFFGSLYGIGASFFADQPPNGIPPGFGSVPAHNVTIKNFKFGLSSHFGIRGGDLIEQPTESNIRIYNCIFKQHQSANINYQGPSNISIRKCKFYGYKNVADFTAVNTQLVLTLQLLNALIQNGVPGAQEQLDALNLFVEQNPERFNRPQINATTNYGIFINSGTNSIFKFPVNYITNSIAKSISSSPNPDNVKITDCTFKDFLITAKEFVGVGSNCAIGSDEGCIEQVSPIGIPQTTIPLSISGLFAVMLWEDAFWKSNNFNPNAFIKAMAFIVNFFGTNNPVFPTNAQAMIDSILNSDEELFYANCAPVLGLGGDGNISKGLFGIRMVGVNNARLENIKMCNFVSNGLEGIVPESLPGYDKVTMPLPVTRYRGNDAWFVSFEVCPDVFEPNDNRIVYKNSCLRNITSLNGYTFGVDMPQDDQNILVKNVCINGMNSPFSGPETSTTDLGDVFAFNVENNNPNGKIILKNVTTKNLNAAGEAFPFPTPADSVILINARAK